MPQGGVLVSQVTCLSGFIYVSAQWTPKRKYIFLHENGKQWDKGWASMQYTLYYALQKWLLGLFLVILFGLLRCMGLMKPACWPIITVIINWLSHTEYLYDVIYFLWVFMISIISQDQSICQSISLFFLSPAQHIVFNLVFANRSFKVFTIVHIIHCPALTIGGMWLLCF